MGYLDLTAHNGLLHLLYVLKFLTPFLSGPGPRKPVSLELLVRGVYSALLGVFLVVVGLLKSCLQRLVCPGCLLPT